MPMRPPSFVMAANGEGGGGSYLWGRRLRRRPAGCCALGSFGPADDRVTVFAVSGRRTATAELVGEELHAVADAEDGEAGFEDVCGGLGGAFAVDGGGAAGEDEAAWVEALDPLPGCVVGDEFAVDVALADAAGDEHGVLGAEVEDDDRFGPGGSRGFVGWALFASGGFEVGGDFEVFGGGVRVGCFGSVFGVRGVHGEMIARAGPRDNGTVKKTYQFLAGSSSTSILPNKLALSARPQEVVGLFTSAAQGTSWVPPTTVTPFASSLFNAKAISRITA